MTATELAAHREQRAAWLPGSAATALASSRSPYVAHLANAPGVQPFHGGQQPLVILTAGFVAAQVRGHSREPAFRALSR
jgi:hypothetical protein